MRQWSIPISGSLGWESTHCLRVYQYSHWKKCSCRETQATGTPRIQSQVTARSTGGKACCSSVSWRRRPTSSTPPSSLLHEPTTPQRDTHTTHLTTHTRARKHSIWASDSELNLFGDCVYLLGVGWVRLNFFLLLNYYCLYLTHSVCLRGGVCVCVCLHNVNSGCHAQLSSQ